MPDKMNPPRGLWYEAKRNRWRVRLYKQRHLCHLSYHSSYADAVETLHQAKRNRPKVELPTNPFAQQTPTTRNLLEGLRRAVNNR